jgi:S-adenosylmethionine synthetase
MGETVVRPKEG